MFPLWVLGSIPLKSFVLRVRRRLYDVGLGSTLRLEVRLKAKYVENGRNSKAGRTTRAGSIIYSNIVYQNLILHVNRNTNQIQR